MSTISRILKSIQESRDNDDLRIELMQDLLSHFNSEYSQEKEIIPVLNQIICDKYDDLVVRQHAANELSHYAKSIPNNEFEKIFLDENEDLDLRINMLELVLPLTESGSTNLINKLNEKDELRKYV